MHVNWTSPFKGCGVVFFFLYLYSNLKYILLNTSHFEIWDVLDFNPFKLNELSHACQLDKSGHFQF